MFVKFYSVGTTHDAQKYKPLLTLATALRLPLNLVMAPGYSSVHKNGALKPNCLGSSPSSVASELYDPGMCLDLSVLWLPHL